MDKNLSDKELETMLSDTELFLQLFSLFESMSKKGQHATIETLITYVLKEV